MKYFLILVLLSSNLIHNNQIVKYELEDFDYCTCINKLPFKAEREYKSYDFVFDGEIYHVNKIEIEGKEFYEFSIKVYTDFKASLLSSDIKIISPVQRDMCGVRPETGVIQTFFLNRYGKFTIDSSIELTEKLYIDQCSATVLEFDLKVNRKLLRYSKRTIKTYNEY